MTKKKSFDDYRITPGGIPNDGIMFKDHSKDHRGGHLGHALVQCKNGDILGFYPNCNDDGRGHSGNGWMEYKRSVDGGETWGEEKKLPWSYDMWESQCGTTAMAEKAVCCDDGTIVLFMLICDMTVKPQLSGHLTSWEPYRRAMVLQSIDNGENFFEIGFFNEKAGRVYDVLYHDGRIYALFFANDSRIHHTGNKPEHIYELYVSDDRGVNFTKISDLSIDSLLRCYGTMEFMDDGSLIAYVYDSADEFSTDYCISRDGGYTWDAPQKAHFAKRLRNPQLVRFVDGYFMHGRSGSRGQEGEKGNLVIYYSDDGLTWDEGHFLQMRGTGFAAYSNNLVVTDPKSKKKRLYIHSSYAYFEKRAALAAARKCCCRISF